MAWMGHIHITSSGPEHALQNHGIKAVLGESQTCKTHQWTGLKHVQCHLHPTHPDLQVGPVGLTPSHSSQSRPSSPSWVPWATADSDSTTEVLQCGWSWTESSQEAGFCLNLWLCDNIHHTLMVQWQKDPTQTLHNCTHNTYMYILHTQTNTYICIHTCMDSTQYSSWQKGSKNYPQY